MSRNKDRLGGSQHQDTQPPAQTGGFSFVVPTEFVELPSQGRFYPQGHPLHGQDSIEIRQMTAKEEDMLTSRSLLKKGVALERVIASLITDKKINPDILMHVEIIAYDTGFRGVGFCVDNKNYSQSM